MIFDTEDIPLPFPKTAISAKEAEAIKVFSEGHKSEAIEMMTKLVDEYQDNPSPLNNRTQMYRLLKRIEEAMADCQKCIQICESKPEYDGIKRMALLQMGWIKLGVEGESSALPWFEESALMGSQEGKRMAARCNPYSAMCNQMLHEILSKERHFST
jgi:tetratricopeptide (TPR) repeat protein